jgi:HlyD family secretion protein
MKLIPQYFLPISVLFLMCDAGCQRSSADRVQGYVEGEYVYVSAPVAGQLDQLSVSRGTVVRSGDSLFKLDSMPELAVRDEDQALLTQAINDLEDARKGKRPPEIQAIQAQLDQARASLEFAKGDFERSEKSVKSGGVSVRDYDQARSARDQAIKRVTELEAELETARQGQRSDFIAAAEAEVASRKAILAQAEWNLSQKNQNAPAGGVVFDTLYREGEYIPAGRPIVQLLPPGNIKVRAFVPENQIGSYHLGDAVTVHIDGVSPDASGKLNFISPSAEYTPPVIYSQESREKLVFMIEAVFDPSVAINLHPGQPVDLIRAK